MAKLTKRVIDVFKATSKEQFFWDDDLKGFGLRIMPSGRKTFFIQYRAGGRTRRIKVGLYGALTPEQARTRAKELLGDIATGQNPAEMVGIHRKAPTVRDVGARFLRDHVEVRLRPSTQRNYRTIINDVIIPAWGTHKIVDLTRADVSELHHKYRDRPYQANRILSVVSKMMNLTELWGIRPDGSNPCRHVHKYPEKKRERFLSKEEISTLWEYLDQQVQEGNETEYVAGAFKLLLLTGCRRDEIRTIKWEYIQGDVLLLPDSKTGSRRIVLNEAAQDVLNSLDKMDGNPYVIVGEAKDEPFHDLEKPWRRIRSALGLEEVRIHDLRHTAASHMVMDGVPLTVIGKLLGHTQLQTTLRYAHLSNEAERQAANAYGDQIRAFTGGAKPTKKKPSHLRVVR